MIKFNVRIISSGLIVAIITGVAIKVWLQQPSALEKEFRQKFSYTLVPLPPVNFQKALGREVNPDEVELGRLLFSDPILSRNNDVSCATCHLSNHGFADSSSLTFGALGRGGPNGNTVGKLFGEGDLQFDRGCGDDGLGFLCTTPMFRNVPTIINTAYRVDRNTNQGLLWDGRFGDLDFQTILPIHTGEELCGTNPIPMGEKNTFRAGGPLFDKPVRVNHSHLADYFEGKNLNQFNAAAEDITGIPSYRLNGTLSTPTRNECVAIAVAKIRKVPEYVNLFKKAFSSETMHDVHIGMALSSYISTVVSKRTPYDKFVDGQNSLTEAQIRGLALFSTEIGATQNLGGRVLKGAGCIDCHSPPEFGGHGFESLGVAGDARSILSKPKVIFSQSGFLIKLSTIRGILPNCHREGISAEIGAVAPDIGRANGSSEANDCFKFRIPSLRNVIETAPYFHHGTARGQGSVAKSLMEKNYLALKQVIRYHLRGPINIRVLNSQSTQNVFFDSLFQMDPLVPTEYLKFSNKPDANSLFPLEFSENDIDDLAQFIGLGLFDPQAVVTGEIGNNVGHPKTVPSGFQPTITRDEGTQLELPPAAKF